MKIRDLNINDLMILEVEAKFPLPRLANHLYIIKKSVELDGKLLGSFWVKMTSETSLILRPEMSHFEKARAIKAIFNSLYDELQKLGFDDSHLFIENDDNYVNFLKKHFNFKDNLGTALYIGRKDNGKITN